MLTSQRYQAKDSSLPFLPLSSFWLLVLSMPQKSLLFLPQSNRNHDSRSQTTCPTTNPKHLTKAGYTLRKNHSSWASRVSQVISMRLRHGGSQEESRSQKQKWVMWWGRWTVVSFVLMASSTSCRDCGGSGKVAFGGVSALHTTRPLMMMCLRGGSLAGEGGSSRTSGAGEDGRFERDGSLAGSRYVNFLIQDGNSVSACLIRLRAEVADSTLSFGSRQRSESLLVE